MILFFFDGYALQWKFIISVLKLASLRLFEPPHDKTNNVVVRPAKTQISLGIRLV